MKKLTWTVAAMNTSGLTIDNYDPAGNLLAHLQGTVHATRITVKTDLKDLF